MTGDDGVVPLTRATGLDRSLIGGKAASLVQLGALGLRTPPGFVVTTDVWREHRAHGRLPARTAAAIGAAVRRLEQVTGRRFGGAVDPLLLSVRSAPVTSMPGMLDTILGVGFGPGTRPALAAAVDDAFARRCHRRFLSGWSATVVGEPPPECDEDELVRRLEDRVPADVGQQLLDAVEAVLGSWEGERSRAYRAHHGIDEGSGTAVVVQAMVFGDLGPSSGAGVAFSRDPDTGEPGLCGDFLSGAQGVDVVAGTHATQPVAALADVAPDALAELRTAVATLEATTGDMVDVEFTVEEGTLHLLQHRPGPRAAAAAVRIAVELVDAGVITVDQAVGRVTAAQLELAARPTVAPHAPDLLATGLGACPGVATGAVCLRADHVVLHAGPVVLVRPETSPHDVHGMVASAGLLTARGGLVSHAALLARELDLPAVVGVEELEVDEPSGTATLGGTVLREGDLLTVDGTSGRVHAGASPVLPAAPAPHLERLRGWSEGSREGSGPG